MDTSKRPGSGGSEEGAPTETPTSNKKAKHGVEDAETKEDILLKASAEDLKPLEKEGPPSSDGKKPKAGAAVDEEKVAAGEEEDETGETKGKSDDEPADAAAAARTAMMMEEDLQYDSGFTTFPEKLMSLLDSEECKDRMWWLPDGDGFAFKPENFAETVLAHHFQGTKLESFTRKLNRWGFKRVAGQMVPPSTFAYFHRSFVRGKSEQVKEMSGSKNKQANALRGQRMQQQLQLAVAREEEAASAQQASSNHPAFIQQDVSQQARAMEGGGMFFPGGSTGGDPRVDYYLMQQQNQQDRINELALLEQQRLASLDPEIQMRLLRGGSTYTGFPPGASSNLLGQQMSFNPRFDSSANAAALSNERMTSMRGGAPWMQMQQQMMQQQQLQQQQQMMPQQQQTQEHLQQSNDGSSSGSQGAHGAAQPSEGDTTEEGKLDSSAATGTDPQMFQLYLMQQQQQREQERRGKPSS